MISVTLFNQERFRDWKKLTPFYINDEDFQLMYDWCDMTFGSDNVGVTHFSAYVYYDHTTRARRKRMDVRLYFKNETDMGFFLMKYSPEFNER